MIEAVASRVATYARVSTVEQAASGLSLDMQEAKMRALADAHDMHIVAAIRDEGRSAGTLDRPGITTIRRLADDRVIDAVMVYSLDRLTRSVVDFATLLAQLDHVGVALVSVRDALDTSSAGGRLVVNVMLSVSQWEREIIAERTAAALAHAKRRGTFLGKPPVGYSVRAGRLVPNERHPLVQRAHSLRANGLTLVQIARHLDHEGVPTGSGRGRWHGESVARLLRSPLTPPLAT